MSKKPDTVDGDLQESLITCNTSQGMELRATLLQFTRFVAVFEIYNPSNVLRMSEVLRDFRIIINGRTIYCGEAVVSDLIEMGGITVCKAKIDESGQIISHFSSQDGKTSLGNGFNEFFRHWEKSYKVLPEFKVVMADMQMLLLDLRLWLEEVELGVRTQPTASRREEAEHDFLQGLVEPLIPTLGPLVERFENIAAGIEKEMQPVHGLYARRQLHPVVLCSPFLYRTYHKPLGYAGDYEMVNMMIRDPFEGASVFAKVINTFFLNTPPVIAHRHRITYLHQRLVEEALRGARRGKPIKIFNLGCGPALEIQRFLEHEGQLCDFTEFMLVDFNDETIQYTGEVLGRLKKQFYRRTPVELQRKSVHYVLKESSKPVVNGSDKKHDFVYCTGLFDYLSQRTCKQLMNIFWEWLAPGGLLLVCNVDTSNPSRGWMEYVLDWNLIYRNSQEMTAMSPDKAPADAARIISESSGVNIFLEIRKPDHA